MEKQNVKEVEELKNSSVATAIAQQNEVVEESVDFNNKLFVQRREIPNIKSADGRSIYDYYIEAELRGQKIKINFEPKDVKGYKALEFVYGNDDFAELVITDSKMQNSKGKFDIYRKLEVVNYDELGIKYLADIKCSETSDKNLLDMYISTLQHKNNK